jgi:PAS domain-containing protein
MCVCTDARIDYINHAGVALLGAKKAHEIVGRSLFDFLLRNIVRFLTVTFRLWSPKREWFRFVWFD